MDNKLDCEIVRDLMPSYIDGLTGEVTSKAIEEHVQDCAECSEALRRMKEPESEKTEDTAQVDYLKKIRRHSHRTVIGGMLATVLIIAVGALIWLFAIGSKADPATVKCMGVSVSEKVTVSGTLIDSGMGFSRAKFSQEGGVLTVDVYTAPVTAFSSGDFTADYTPKQPVTQVKIGNLVIWDKGVTLTSLASRLYNARTAYVGDAPAVLNIAEIIGVYDRFGEFESELHTADEPYNWTLTLETPVPASRESAVQAEMKTKSVMMFAAIGNLGEVTWEYTVNGGARSFTISLEDAAQFAGRDVREYSDTPWGMQTLLSSLGYDTNAVEDTSASAEDIKFTISVKNESVDPVYFVGLTYYLNGRLIGSSACGNADSSALRRSETLEFSFTPSYFPSDTGMAELGGFSFDVTVTGEDGIEYKVAENVSPEVRYSWLYTYVLTGGTQDGFEIEEV